MHQITINVNQSIYEHIMFFLQNLPQNLIKIQSKPIIQNHSVTESKQSAFGILKNRIDDPVQWQRDIREESDRDI